MNRRGNTPVLIVFGILIAALLVGGVILFQRVSKLNTWAVEQEIWLEDKLYMWIKNNSFQQGSGSGDPDPTKPPPPPGGLE